MNMKNRVSLIGRLTAEPECQTSGAGKPYMNFDLAVDKEIGRKNEVDFIPCCAFGKIAEFICKHFSKGQMINAFGSVITSVWADKNREKQKQVRIKITNVDFYGFKQNDSLTNEQLKQRNEKKYGNIIENDFDDIINDNDFETF